MKNTLEINFKEIEAENNRRNEALKTDYNPISGKGSYGKRIECFINGNSYFLPEQMIKEHNIARYMKQEELELIRIRYDFEFWCARCVTIKDKVSARSIHFMLNAPQRRVLATLEDMRTSGNPIRLIMLKARQWGGSTVIPNDFYIACFL